MKTKLMPTQEADIARMVAGQDIPNFSEPGTGKTLNTIGAIEAAGLQSGVVVCPPVATIMWRDLLTDELGARVQWLEKKATEINMLADFYVVSYSILNAHLPLLLDHDNDALVVDESHYCKSSEAQRTQAVFGPTCDGGDGLYETSKQCWLLTGTPIERYADDLWSQLRATQPQALQEYRALTLADFQQQFCRMKMQEYADGAVRKWVSVANQNELVLNSMLYDDIGAIRRFMHEVDPYMPEATMRDVWVKSDINKELTAFLKNKTPEQLKELLLKNDIHMATMRRLMGQAKIRGIIEYVMSIDEPVLLGYWHTEVGNELAMSLQSLGKRVKLIGGATPTKARETIKRAFMDGGLDIIVGQISAMGIAMDGLQTVGKRVVVAEDDWSPSKIEQFYKRLARKGQRGHVQVDFCRSTISLDKLIADIRDGKMGGIDTIINRA